MVQKAKETGTRDEGSVTNRKPKQRKMAVPKKPKLAKPSTTPTADPVSTTTPPEPASEPGPRNKQADALSRTIFPFQAGADQLLQYLGSIDSSGSDRKWIWKDGKGGYNELLKLRNNPIVTHSNYASVSPPSSQQTLDSEAFMWSHLEYVALNTSSPNVRSLHI